MQAKTMRQTTSISPTIRRNSSSNRMMYKTLLATLLLLAPSTQQHSNNVANAQSFPWRINSGAADPWTFDNIEWSPDVHYTSGYFDNTNRCDTGPHCKIRSFNAGIQSPPFGYGIPVPSADYEVRLHFVETYWTQPGKRLMDVYVEGVNVFPGLDIFSEAGWKNTPFSFAVNTTVTDGFLNIELVKVALNPMIAGVEIFAPPNPDVRVNCGGPAFTDKTGKEWEADNYFNNKGAAFAIENPSISTFHLSERYFDDAAPYVYEVPVKFGGEVHVTLHFMEIYHENPGFRVFDVYVEGILVAPALDIYAQVGYLQPLEITTITNIADGFATIELAGITGAPKISGIEVVDMVNYEPRSLAPTTSPMPSFSPTLSPAPTVSPAPTSSPTAYVWEDVLINCGGGDYQDVSGERLWLSDRYFTGGGVYVDGTNDILGTLDDTLYHSERYGDVSYEIPLPVANYEVILHFTELFWELPQQRVFNLVIESTTYYAVDVVQLGGGPNVAFTIESAEIVSDGFLSISLTSVVPPIDMPKLSAIEVKLVGPHLAHAVSNGPYYAVDIDGSGFATVDVDAGPSHTHGTDLDLINWTWKEGPDVLSSGIETASFTMDVGVHDVALTVLDNGGNDSTDYTTITIFPFGYPVISSLSQTSGSVTGGNSITITGIGFTYSAAETTVRIGLSTLTGADINIIDDNNIEFVVPLTAVAAPVGVSVETPLGESVAATYTYVAAVPIEFTSALLVNFDSPAVAEFGPDGCLYVGGTGGDLGRFVLNDDHTAVIDDVITKVAPNRNILGIAFDPMDTSDPPSPYISTSLFFHGESDSSSGQAINGDIRKISGANFDVSETIISGLPVSDHDHGVNAITFGDNGELYIQIGSNTNGGVPGQLTGKQIQKENYYSAATIRADLADPLFDGAITYDAADDGTPNGGYGISVFASGLRNPYGITLHSNGNLYGTDNGPNGGYGDMQTGCGPGEQIPDETDPDEVVLLKEGAYYGHPNSKRAEVDSDPRQCAWRSAFEPSDADYTAPLLPVPSSMDGIIEWQTDHFFGQLRGNLIISKYTQGTFRVILTPDGEDVIPESNPAIPFVGDGTLDITQAPSGTLIDVRLVDNKLFFHKPLEPPSTSLFVNGVFPRRGGQAGGQIISIYGVNFDNGVPTVKVGGKDCPMLEHSPTIIQCTLPPGFGTVDVVVETSEEISTFKNGYRYITGLPVGSTAAPVTMAPSIPTSAAPTIAPTISSTTDAPTTLAPSSAATTGSPTANPTVADSTSEPSSSGTPTPAPSASTSNSPEPTPFGSTDAPTFTPSLSVTDAPTVFSTTSTPTVITNEPTIGLTTSSPTLTSGSTVVLQTNFASSADGFSYQDDLFGGNEGAVYASGTYQPTGGISSDGALEVLLGGIDTNNIDDMSGGWVRDFVLPQAGAVTITVTFELEQSMEYEADEESEALVSLDGTLLGVGGNPYLALIAGCNCDENQVTGYTTVTLDAGQLTAGTHTIAIGGYNSRKTWDNEYTLVRFDSVEILVDLPPTSAAPTTAPTILSTTDAPTTLSPSNAATTGSPTANPTVADSTTEPSSSGSPTPAPSTSTSNSPEPTPFGSTDAPTFAPSLSVTVAPTVLSTTNAPVNTDAPTITGTTDAPTILPSLRVTDAPTMVSTTSAPTVNTAAPTATGTTDVPTISPSLSVTDAPTMVSTTSAPTINTAVPTVTGTTDAPTISPSLGVTDAPTVLSATSSPTVSTDAPTPFGTTDAPTVAPFLTMTDVPTEAPTAEVTTMEPSLGPTPFPSQAATTELPTILPTLSVMTISPTVAPTVAPTVLSTTLEPTIGSTTSSPTLTSGSTVVLQTNFSSSADGFSYQDDLFGGNEGAVYASGTYQSTGGISSDGALEVLLGGIDTNNIDDMSGGWVRDFVLPQAGAVTITVTYELEQDMEYEADEESEALVSVDGTLLGVGGNSYLALIAGCNCDENQSTGYTKVTLDAGQLAAGTHTIAIGGYNSRKTWDDEYTWVRFDSVEIIVD